MKLEKFIEKLDKGEIRDLKPYIEKAERILHPNEVWVV